MSVEYLILEGKKIDDSRISIESIFGFSGSLDLNTISEARKRIGEEIRKKFPNIKDYRLRPIIEIDSKTLVATIKGEAYV